MYKEFFKKMIRAERLKYEAVKEIMPDSLRKRVDAFEKETFNLLKDIALEMIEEDAELKKPESKKGSKKIDVDFSE